ncbi:MAG: hypothetical protein HYT78_02350 [Deltaproteobacteria bacterium]|nr:hypothetical protein [Deltaproteobacteria bacterium]
MVIPRYAATYSAFGMLNMEVGRDFARSIVSRVKLLNLAHLDGLFSEMEAEARRVLGEIGVPPGEVVRRRSVEMRYVGQFHEVEVVAVPLGKIGAEELEAIVKAFHRRHKELYTFDMPDREVEMLNARLKATARREPLRLAEVPEAEGPASQALKRSRPVLWSKGNGYAETPVYDGDRLAAGHVLDGPAIIEEKTTTVVIPAAYRCRVDGVRNYILSRR